MKVCAVIVTYNRLELLKLTINNLKKQTYKLDEIIVINNASTDGTDQYLNTQLNELKIINLTENLGGAGGFSKGIEYASTQDFDYIWVMDDDTITTSNALEKMISALDELKNKKVGFLCSNVLYKDNTPCLMNIPEPCHIWNEFSNKGIIKVKNASFVSLLIKNEIVKEIGLPISEFFIWADDLEYTKRIIKNYEGYLIGDSIVHHYMNENSGANILKDNSDRINRYYYEFRNKYYIAKKEGIMAVLKYNIDFIKIVLKIIFKTNKLRLKKIKVLLRAYWSGLFFNPEIKYINK